jgi:hypothetical protein
MVKLPILRTKSVTTKVTEAEYARLEEQAALAGLNLSEWIRGRLLEGGSAAVESGAVLGEVLALRTILLNLLFSISQGKAVTAESMQELIGKADSGKVERALERLEASRREAMAVAAEDAVKES